MGRIVLQVRRFRSSFPNVALHYAVKANPYAPLLEAMAGLVDGFDVASAGELGRVAHLGLPISFAGPGKRDQELETAIRAGVTINLESEGEAERVLAICSREGLPARLAIRVNPPFGLKGSGQKMGGLPSQFGIDHERVPALIRNSPAGGWARYPHRPRAARPSRRQHDRVRCLWNMQVRGIVKRPA